MAVVTVNNLGGSTVEDFAQDLFTRWKIGKKGKDNGVLLLAAIQDRKVRIHVGYGLEPDLTDARCGEIIRENIRPRFKTGAYGAGILAGIDGIIAAIPGGTAAVPAPTSGPYKLPAQPTARAWVPPPPPASVPAPAAPPSNSGYGLLGFLCMLVPVGAIGLALYAVVRALTRPKLCPRCGTEMEKVSEMDEDQYLQGSQQLEQRIGSVDYRVWRCPKCQEKEVTEHNALFSSYKECPKCGNRTLSESESVIEEPTYSHTGLAQVTRNCVWTDCDYREEHTRTIPRLEDNSSVGTGFVIGASSNDSSWNSSSSDSSWSSSDSSSSYDSGPSDFGGGDSGGGGASDSW